MESASSNVELVSVTKRYGTTAAVSDISLRIPKGSYCCLLGPSGCGKTSTLRMSAGHEAISEVDVIIGGVNVGDLLPVNSVTPWTVYPPKPTSKRRFPWYPPAKCVTLLP
ncbi:ATP-binding cassette domain-containing protein [Acidisoma cladoniae]|jgi:ABC-type Fe3+/spermidine/putrescine transport system ATPase subunit|uniref:ATP-binding cassette domain-containing protein n=1 Tax=Acidisoma cladoniae TaxID=3040935 RepID=UPI00331366D3